MSQTIQSYSPWNIVAENIQITDDRRTIGELDFILKHTETQRMLHLELACKFYLYDPELETETARWIGPNRRDSLERKLKKLQVQQFPLLSEPATQKALKELKIDSRSIDQAISIKSMLFLPFGMERIPPGVNAKAIKGFWLRTGQLDNFSDSLWHLPDKINWAVHPKHNEQWDNYTAFRKKLQRWLGDIRAPMCWVRTPENTFKRLFVVWW